VRLNPTEIEAIKNCCSKVFGDEAKVYLFGSRVDDTRRGGDIDLLIEIEPSSNNHFERKLDFLVELKKLIGDQKIDVLLDYGQETDQVYTTAKKEGIEL
jgi:predicted nucleotidyltransferase